RCASTRGWHCRSTAAPNSWNGSSPKAWSRTPSAANSSSTHPTSRRSEQATKTTAGPSGPPSGDHMDLKLKNITHRYGTVEVLRDISLDIPQGQIVCLVGPSGCGKSTLFRFLGGLERPDSGEVLQIGQPPRDCLNPLTYVFQHFA